MHTQIQLEANGFGFLFSAELDLAIALSNLKHIIAETFELRHIPTKQKYLWRM